MKRNKLQRFAENKENPHVIQHNEIETDKAVDWLKAFSNIGHNESEGMQKLILELGCGTGIFTVELAQKNPHFNYIGIDIKGSRLWKGASIAQEEKLSNVLFLRCQIENIEKYFKPEQVDGIYITFPDPRPKDRDEKRRLTHKRYLEVYKKILRKTGSIFFKSDDDDLYFFTRDECLDNGFAVIHDTMHLHQEFSDLEVAQVKTTYEKRFIEEGKKINYLSFRQDIPNLLHV